MPSRPPINIQDAQLFQLLKDRTPVMFELVTGQSFGGLVLRFDRYCILVQQRNGAERLVYKHALGCIGMMADARSRRTPVPRSASSKPVPVGARGRR